MKLLVLVQSSNLNGNPAIYKEVWRNVAVRLVLDFADCKASEVLLDRSLRCVHSILA